MPKKAIFRSTGAPTLILPRAKDPFITRNPIEIVRILYPKQTKQLPNITQSPHITLDLIEQFEDSINWYSLSSNLYLTPAIIKRYNDKLDWGSISSEDCANYSVSANPVLVGVGFYTLSFTEVVDLIDSCSDLINWEIFSEYQNLSIPLIEHYHDRIDWSSLSYNKHLTVNIFERFIDEFIEHGFERSIDTLINNNQITPDFIERHHDIFSPRVWKSISYLCMNKFLDVILDHPEWPWNWD